MDSTQQFFPSRQLWVSWLVSLFPAVDRWTTAAVTMIETPRKASSRQDPIHEDGPGLARVILSVTVCASVAASVLWDRGALLSEVRSVGGALRSLPAAPQSVVWLVFLAIQTLSGFAASPLAPEVTRQAASALGFEAGWFCGAAGGLGGACLAFCVGNWLLKAQAERVLTEHPRGQALLKQ